MISPSSSSKIRLPGFDVAVNDADAVRGAEPARRLQRDAHGRLRLERAQLVDHAIEIAALEQGHDQEQQAGDAVGARVQGAHDVRVLETAHQLALAQEALRRQRPHDLGAQRLERDLGAVGGGCSIDGAHRALTDQRS
jgi:hypothetical protein